MSLGAVFDVLNKVLGWLPGKEESLRNNIEKKEEELRLLINEKNPDSTNRTRAIKLIDELSELHRKARNR